MLIMKFTRCLHSAQGRLPVNILWNVRRPSCCTHPSVCTLSKRQYSCVTPGPAPIATALSSPLHGRIWNSEYYLVKPACSDHFIGQRHFSVDTLRHYYSPEFPPVGYAQKFLEFTHDITGLPWWATILVATFTLRTVITLPLTVYANRNMVKLMKLGPEMKEKSEELRVEVASAIKLYKWDPKTAQYWYRKNMRRLIQEMYVRENCHPLKTSLVFFIQIPMWLGVSLALRNMSGRTPFQSAIFLQAIHPELSEGGMLWFTNFMVPDCYFILPLLCGLVNLLNVELSALGRAEQTKMQKYVSYFYRSAALIVVPLGLILPSCMVYYWTCSSLYGLGSTLVMKHPKIKRLLGIPAMPNESSSPYKDMWTMLKERSTKRS